MNKDIADCECGHTHKPKEHKDKCKKCGKHRRGCRGPTGPPGNCDVGCTGGTGPTGPTGAPGIVDCGSLLGVTGSNPSDQVLISTQVENIGLTGFTGPFAPENWIFEAVGVPEDDASGTVTEQSIIISSFKGNQSEDGSYALERLDFIDDNLSEGCQVNVTFTASVEYIGDAAGNTGAFEAYAEVNQNAPGIFFDSDPKKYDLVLQSGDVLTFTQRNNYTGEDSNAQAILTITDFEFNYSCCDIVTVAKEEFGAPIVFSAPNVPIVIPSPPLENNGEKQIEENMVAVGFGTYGRFSNNDNDNSSPNGFIFRAPRDGYLKNLYVTFHGKITGGTLPPNYILTLTVYVGNNISLPDTISKTLLSAVLDLSGKTSSFIVNTEDLDHVVYVKAGQHISFVIEQAINNEMYVTSNISGAVLFV